VDLGLEAERLGRGASGTGTSRSRHSLVIVSTIVHVPDEIAERLAAEAARRQMSLDEVAAEALAARYPPSHADPGLDALEAFIGSGDSGSTKPFDIHEARSELAKRKFAEGI
jgi:hypothetical protein